MNHYCKWRLRAKLEVQIKIIVFWYPKNCDLKIRKNFWKGLNWNDAIYDERTVFPFCTSTSIFVGEILICLRFIFDNHKNLSWSFSKTLKISKYVPIIPISSALKKNIGRFSLYHAVLVIFERNWFVVFSIITETQLHLFIPVF